MPLTLPADAGEPMSAHPVADAAVRRCEFPAVTRQVSLRNTGKNTLWILLDGGAWFDVACGTSWEDRVSIQGFQYCTQMGKTRFAVVGIALMGIPPGDGDADDDDDDQER